MCAMKNQNFDKSCDRAARPYGRFNKLHVDLTILCLYFFESTLD